MFILAVGEGFSLSGLRGEFWVLLAVFVLAVFSFVCLGRYWSCSVSLACSHLLLYLFPLVALCYSLVFCSTCTFSTFMFSVYLFLFYMLLVFVIPVCEFLSPRWYRAFLLRISRSASGRRFLVCILALLVIFFHLVYFAAFSFSRSIMISTVFVFFLLSTRRTVRLLELIGSSRLLSLLLALVCVLFAAFPLLFPSAVSLTFLLEFALIMPAVSWRRDGGRLSAFSLSSARLILLRRLRRRLFFALLRFRRACSSSRSRVTGLSRVFGTIFKNRGA